MSIERLPIRNRGEWLSWRAADVTASEIAALFGLHPYRSLLQVFLSKTGAEVGDQGENSAMRRGRILEPGVAVAVEDEKPDWALVKTNMYIRDAVARIGATPDYLISGDNRGTGILECKSAAPDMFERNWAEGAPQYCVLQTLTQMMLENAAFGVIACLVDSRAKDLFLYDVPRHAAAEELIRHKVAQFWAAVAAGNMPSPDYKRDADAITSLFRRDNGQSVSLSHDNRLPSLLDERETLKAAMKATGEQLETCEAEIKHKIGDAAEAHLPGWKLSHKLQQRKGYEVKATEFRVLRVVKLKAEAA